MLAEDDVPEWFCSNYDRGVVLERVHDQIVDARWQHHVDPTTTPTVWEDLTVEPPQWAHA